MCVCRLVVYILNKLINQISKISNSLSNLYAENKLNKKTIDKLNQKINLMNSKECSSLNKDFIEKYEKKLKEINIQYQNNEKDIQNQINELKELN